MPLLPKLEGSSSSTACMLCETVWTAQLSWNLYHSHKQTEKSNAVTQKNGAWHCSLRVEIFLYIGEDMLTWSSASQIVSNKMTYFANCGSEIHSIDIYCWVSYGLSIHIPNMKTGSKAFLRCFAFPKDYPQNQAWVYIKESSTLQPFCLNSFFSKEWNSWVVSPEENKEGPNSTNLLFTFPKRIWPFLPSSAAFTRTKSWVKLQYQQLPSIGCVFWKGIA